MKHHSVFLLTIISLCFFQSAKSISADDMYLSSPLTANNQASITSLVGTVNTYPLLGITSDGVVQGAQNRAIKAMTPAKTRPLFRKAALSILRPGKEAFKNYPAGASLFSGYPDLSTKFDAMINGFKIDPKFIPFFRKVHINILNELYHHLMCVYMNFNLQHAGIKQNSKGDMQISIPLFLHDEKTFAANNKTLIINHLIGVIESQFNGAIRSYTNNMPHTFATFIGKTAIQNDYSIDLTEFIVKQIEPELKSKKQTYLKSFGDYLSFFQAYTSYLNKPHPTKPNHFTAFVDIAEKINGYLYGGVNAAEDKTVASLAKMNPALFHFRYDDIRALKLIPHLAKSMPTGVQSIVWPDHIVQAAQEGVIVSPSGQKPHPLAYFRTSDGTIVRNMSADKTIPLYICMRLGENLFEQQLLPQPEWMNSWEGVCKILCACFGDFSAILGMGILDPCTEALVSNVVLTAKGQDANANANISAACTKLIAKWKKLQKGSVSANSISLQNENSLSTPGLSGPPATPPLVVQP